jgi:hypothetical protein
MKKLYDIISRIVKSVFKFRNNYRIEYTTTDGLIVDPLMPYISDIEGFQLDPKELKLKIVSNIYKDGKGTITFNRKIRSIGFQMFTSCPTLSSIKIPNSVTRIRYGAFDHCIALNDITIGKNVIIIEAEAFNHCTSLKTITIPNNVVEIGEGAFFGCTNLESITLPNSVTQMGDRIFSHCSNLKQVSIGTGIVSLSKDSFLKCSSLTNIIFSNNITKISSCAFWQCESLESITIPNSIKEIDYGAFYKCNSLSAVHITDLATWCNIKFESEDANPLYLGKKLYLNNKLVTDLNIPISTSSIGEFTFYDYPYLTSVIIPDSVININSSAFNGCKNLESVFCKAAIPPTIGDNVFNHNANKRKIFVPKSSIESYATSENWNKYASDIIGYDF